MATKTIAPNVYERDGFFQVRISRRDAFGVTQKINQSFHYEKKQQAAHHHSRAAALAEAKRFAGEQVAALRIEGRRAVEDDEPMTFGHLLTQYGEQVTPTKRPAGRSREIAIIRGMLQLCPALCQKHPESLRAVDFVGTKPGAVVPLLRAAGLKPNTIRRWLALCSHAYTVARSQWGFEWPNPLLHAQKPHEDDSRDRLVTPEEWERIIEACGQARAETRAALTFLRWTAARRSEAQALQWENVTWGQQVTAMLLDTKTPKKGEKKQRAIPIPAEAAKAMRGLFSGRKPPEAGPVFGGFRADTLTQAWVRACRAAEIKQPPRLHDLRHTRTTELAGILSIQELAKITGHSDLKMLLRYYHPSAEDLGKKIEDAAAITASTRRPKRKKQRTVA